MKCDEEYIDYDIDVGEEAGVYVATCKDIPKFVIKADSYESLIQRMDMIAKELFNSRF